MISSRWCFYGDSNPGPLRKMQVLFQLSYSPTEGGV